MLVIVTTREIWTIWDLSKYSAGTGVGADLKMTGDHDCSPPSKLMTLINRSTLMNMTRTHQADNQ